MTLLLDHSPSLVEVLRGDRSARPPSDRRVASGLRSMIEDGLYGVVGDRATEPLVVRASSLRQSFATTDLAASATSRLRGVLVNQVLRLLSVAMVVDDPFHDALAAWRAEGSRGALHEAFDQMDTDDRARLETDVNAHCVTLRRALGDVPQGWMPRSSVRAVQHLAGGSVVLRDVVDLMVGSVNRDVASVALFDVTTAPLGEGSERAMRYHALVQTLRTSTMPLRTAAFSTATGELWTQDVDFALLARSVDEVLGCVTEQTGRP